MSESSFSWGFMIGPKNEDKVINPGIRYFIRRVRIGTEAQPEGFVWMYSEDALPSIKCPARMYARILIAKIENEDRLEQVMRKAPRPAVVEDDPVAMALHDGYNSQVWMSEVLEKLASMPKKQRAVGKAVLDWRLIENTARRYVAEKMAIDRYNESYLRETRHRLPKPTWDMLLDKETAG